MNTKNNNDDQSKRRNLEKRFLISIENDLHRSFLHERFDQASENVHHNNNNNKKKKKDNNSKNNNEGW